MPYVYLGMSFSSLLYLFIHLFIYYLLGGGGKYMVHVTAFDI